jgi:hypothetical protein
METPYKAARSMMTECGIDSCQFKETARDECDFLVILKKNYDEKHGLNGIVNSRAKSETMGDGEHKADERPQQNNQ